jgi:hypothetical protein
MTVSTCLYMINISVYTSTFLPLSHQDAANSDFGKLVATNWIDVSAQCSKTGYFSVLLRAEKKSVSRRYKMSQMYTSVLLINNDNHAFEIMPLVSSTLGQMDLIPGNLFCSKNKPY